MELLSLASLKTTLVGTKNYWARNLSEIGIAWNGRTVSISVQFGQDFSFYAFILISQFVFHIWRSINDTGLYEVRIPKLNTSCAAFCLYIDLLFQYIFIICNCSQKISSSIKVVSGWVVFQVARWAFIIGASALYVLLFFFITTTSFLDLFATDVRWHSFSSCKCTHVTCQNQN